MEIVGTVKLVSSLNNINIVFSINILMISSLHAIYLDYCLVNPKKHMVRYCSSLVLLHCNDSEFLGQDTMSKMSKRVNSNQAKRVNFNTAERVKSSEAKRVKQS